MIEASLRSSSFLWDEPETLPGNPFVGDGDRTVPDTWPGDNFKRCRLWHGIDIGFSLNPDGTIDQESTSVTGHNFIGWSEYCGIFGRAVKTLSLDPHPIFGTDAKGPYVEAHSIMGGRVGMFLPDITWGVPLGSNGSGGFDAGGEAVGALLDTIIEEVARQFAEESFTGTNDDVPSIYSYVCLKVWANGDREAKFVSDNAGGGFLSVSEIINQRIGFSHIPEHHLYLDGNLIDSKGASSPGTNSELVAWIDTFKPGERVGFMGVNAGLRIWCNDATATEKRALIDTFKSEQPQFYAGNRIDGDPVPWE